MNDTNTTFAPITFDADGFVDGSITFTNGLAHSFRTTQGRVDADGAFDDLGIDDTHARTVRRGYAARRLTYDGMLDDTCVGVGIGEYVDAACDAAERRVLARP